MPGTFVQIRRRHLFLYTLRRHVSEHCLDKYTNVNGALMRCSALVQCTVCATVPNDTQKTSLGCELRTSVYIPWSYKRHWNATAKVMREKKKHVHCQYLTPNQNPPLNRCPKWTPGKLPPQCLCISYSLSYGTFPQDSDTAYSLTALKILVINVISSESSSLNSILTTSQSSSILPSCPIFLLMALYQH